MHLYVHPTWGRRSHRGLLQRHQSRQPSVQHQLPPEGCSATWARLSQPEDPAARAHYGELYAVATEGKKGKKNVVKSCPVNHLVCSSNGMLHSRDISVFVGVWSQTKLSCLLFSGSSLGEFMCFSCVTHFTINCQTTQTTRKCATTSEQQNGTFSKSIE